LVTINTVGGQKSGNDETKIPTLKLDV
jgi:hypothetical protein